MRSMTPLAPIYRGVELRKALEFRQDISGALAPDADKTQEPPYNDSMYDTLLRLVPSMERLGADIAFALVLVSVVVSAIH